MTLKVEILLLAAGASSRMQGQDKLLIPIGSETLLERSAKACCNSLAARTILIVRPQDNDRRKAVEGLGLSIVTNRRWQEGMATSIALGMAQLSSGTNFVMVMLADMPDITNSDINLLIAACAADAPKSIIRAASAEHPGNPVIFGSGYFDQLRSLSGDKGARGIIADNSQAVTLVQLSKNHAITDLDTPGDWAEYSG